MICSLALIEVRTSATDLPVHPVDELRLLVIETLDTLSQNGLEPLLCHQEIPQKLKTQQERLDLQTGMKKNAWALGGVVVRACSLILDWQRGITVT
jgi:hypothetical protein